MVSFTCLRESSAIFGKSLFKRSSLHCREGVVEASLLLAVNCLAFLLGAEERSCFVALACKLIPRPVCGRTMLPQTIRASTPAYFQGGRQLLASRGRRAAIAGAPAGAVRGATRGSTCHADTSVGPRPCRARSRGSRRLGDRAGGHAHRRRRKSGKRAVFNERLFNTWQAPQRNRRSAARARADFGRR